MHYYTFHPAKFNHETKMLSRLERAIYRELIDEYTGQEKPLVGDFDKIAWRLAVRSDDEKNALKVVLDNFFVLKTAKNGETHYHHPRLDAEIRAYRWHKKGGTLGNGQGTDGTEQGTLGNGFGTDKERKQRYNQERKHMMNELVKLGVTLDKSVSMADLRSLYVTHVGTDNGTLGNGQGTDGTDKEQNGTPKSDVKQETINNKPVTSNQDISPQTPQGVGVIGKTDEADKTLNVPFETFWDAYDKKVGLQTCQKKWAKLTNQDRTDIMAYIPKYKESKPDKQFRKDPATFLNNRSWEDEIITAVAQQKPQKPKNFRDELAELEQNSPWGDDFYSRNRTANQTPFFEQSQIGVHL